MLHLMRGLLTVELGRQGTQVAQVLAQVDQVLEIRSILDIVYLGHGSLLGLWIPRGSVAKWLFRALWSLSVFELLTPDVRIWSPPSTFPTAPADRYTEDVFSYGCFPQNWSKASVRDLAISVASRWSIWCRGNMNTGLPSLNRATASEEGG
jgi:hypothetical protein